MTLDEFFLLYPHPARCIGATTRSSVVDTYGSVTLTTRTDGEVLNESLSMGKANCMMNRILQNYPNELYVSQVKHNFYDNFSGKQLLTRVIVTTKIRPKEVLRLEIHH